MNDVYIQAPSAGDSAEGVEAPNSVWRSILDFILELVKVTVICAVIIILVRWLLFQPFYVNGASMEPSYYDGEYLIIYQLPFRFADRFHPFTEANRGRTIIFHPPNDPAQFYIKRLIGLPGERVKITEGQVYIYNSENQQGFLLSEGYLPLGTQTLSGNYDDIQLGLNEIYVLGDNRAHSLDSRRLGAIPISNVIGEPVLRGWPWDRFGVIKKPSY
ncbi:MAG: signal peptidase I [Candidatus Jacksonbacteria bacterium RIFOXYC2_FULL_44_29]|nr:MAG: signal peptidase I [Parcubacteria group bacterium GW2011_GWC2_44_22]OGY75480.1 MAG: signal peptidase I [Candidatus Jacksonbacteria bacterium RIFOXYA2_FULL_43_12]OGY76976.1 MAG: signal peptidase I [Candidatus Jacksonbacteria bacterium RIFOXYB2_FULL_44_15]OGY77828.1 MAG: signal peptidase I [Candidatus Jacksonbacteria bacterium RIFOXYC2_FULL_44_29]OGY80245.1 MAG: signal peptidase I [Candidatus Jacksonbacteria bacterium RIFOXYD2_FULL_43_21]HBH46123.1 signal peptidase I [Candidatus Jacksonb